jgi:Holliday junction resolvase RusA-like endonuclease
MRRRNMPVELHAVLDKLPPSVNRLYEYIRFTDRKGNIRTKRKKSKGADKYVTYASKELAKQWGFQPKPPEHVPYELVLVFYLPKLENATWPKSANRFGKRDVTNLIKLLEDIISTACGVDDSCTFDLHVFKRLSTNSPRVEIVLRGIDNESFLYDDVEPDQG